MRSLLLYLVVTFMSNQFAHGKVVKRVLPNGLTVLVKEDHSSPVVAVEMWIRVGSVNETEEMTGLAHFQEHMVFKGTERHGVGEIAKIVKSVGGNLNAGTSYSYTMYYIVLPSRSFSTALELQADAMMNSSFDAGEFKKERIVVIDEARMYDDTPEAYTYYRTMELAFKVHPYRRPIAGYEKVVRKITRDQLLDFYKTYYRPSNAVLVMVGDVEAERALAEAEKLYGGWSDRREKVFEPRDEPVQSAFRFRCLRGSVEHAYLGAAFHIPDIKHPDYPALEVIAGLLTSGKSSRLYQELREKKKLVTKVKAEVLAEKWPGCFLIQASMPVEKWETAAKSIFEELERFRKDDVDEAELEKARLQLEKSIYAELETVEGQASNLGYYEAMGDYRLAEMYREAIRKVKAEDIRQVASRYFGPENCSLVAYLPRKWEGEVPDREEVEAKLSGALSPCEVRWGQHVQPTVPQRERVEEGVGKSDEAAAEAEIFKLANGARVVHRRRPAVPVVSVVAVFQGGARLEPRGKSGLALLTTRCLIKGTKSYDARQIAEGIENLGGSIETFSSFDVSGVYANVLSRNLDAVVPILKEVLLEAAFPGAEVEKEKEKLLEELAQRRDNPVLLSIDSLFSAVFAPHPYSKPFLGKAEELAGLGPDDCRSWYNHVMVPDNLVLALVGDLSREEARRIAEALVGDMPAAPLSIPLPEIIDQPGKAGVHVIRKEKLKQAMSLVGFLAPPMMSDGAVALEILNGVLTGLGGRLFVELRDKRSLGYMAGSAFVPLRDISLFFGYANPTAEGVEEAARVIIEELEKVKREGLKEEEVKRAKEWLVGTQIMQLQKNLSQAMAYATYEVLGFGYRTVDAMPQRIRAVGREEVKAVSQSVFDESKAVFVRLLPAE